MTDPGLPEEVAGDARTFGMLCHLSALSGFIGVPFGNILGPLVVWLVKRNDHPFVDDQGKEALSFQISLLIYVVAGGVAAVALAFFGEPVLLFLAIAAVIAIGIFGFVMTIVASVRANRSEWYRYPASIRFLT